LDTYFDKKTCIKCLNELIFLRSFCLSTHVGVNLAAACFLIKLCLRPELDPCDGLLPVVDSFLIMVMFAWLGVCLSLLI